MAGTGLIVGGFNTNWTVKVCFAQYYKQNHCELDCLPGTYRVYVSGLPRFFHPTHHNPH